MVKRLDEHNCELPGKRYVNKEKLDTGTIIACKKCNASYVLEWNWFSDTVEWKRTNVIYNSNEVNKHAGFS
jgi:hypothetical protein